MKGHMEEDRQAILNEIDKLEKARTSNHNMQATARDTIIRTRNSPR